MAEIQIENLPSNSIKDRKKNNISNDKKDIKNKKELKKIVSGSVVRKKKSFGSKMKEAIFGDVDDVKEYLLYDILIPSVKNTLYDLVVNGIKMKLFGDSQPSRDIKREGGRSYVKFSSYNSRNSRYDSPRRSINNRSSFNFDDIILERRDEAENVLSELYYYTKKYGLASVADLYTLVGIESSFTDNKYGWDDVSDVCVVRVPNGYKLDLPRPQLID